MGNEREVRDVDGHELGASPCPRAPPRRQQHPVPWVQEGLAAGGDHAPHLGGAGRCLAALRDAHRPQDAAPNDRSASWLAINRVAMKYTVAVVPPRTTLASPKSTCVVSASANAGGT